MFKVNYVLPNGQTGYVHVRGLVTESEATMTARAQVGSAAKLAPPSLIPHPTAIRSTRGRKISLVQSSINSCLPYSASPSLAE